MSLIVGVRCIDEHEKLEIEALFNEAEGLLMHKYKRKFRRAEVLIEALKTLIEKLKS